MKTYQYDNVGTEGDEPRWSVLERIGYFTTLVLVIAGAWAVAVMVLSLDVHVP